MQPPIKELIIVESDRFSLDCPMEKGVSYDLPLGDDLAAHLAEALRHRFRDVVVDEPIREDWGTVLFVDVGGTSFELCINWMPIEGRPEGTWAIQFDEYRGCLMSLFGRRRPAHERCIPMMRRVEAVIDAEPSVFRNAAWLTDEEFKAVY